MINLGLGMMDLVNKILLYGEIPVNCYIIENDGLCYIVDPGYEKERVIDYIKNKGLSVKGILLTHGHIDHIGAIDSFDVPVYLHEVEYEILVDNHKNGFEFYGREKPYNLEDIKVIKIDENKKFTLGNKVIEVVFTPGHTIGGVCYKIDNDLYTGDTLFKETVGRWDFPTGNLEVLKKSIVNLVDSMDDEVRIHPAHGDSSTIGYEKKENEYYKAWKKELNKF
ncbi:MAG: MBL fold metallo-hydrolase [Sarcina sp.]